MERITQEQNKYLMFGVPVEVNLVYGPVIYTFETGSENEKLPIQDLIEQIKSQEKIDLTKFSNSYITTGLNVVENNKKIRHEFVFFFLSKPVLN
jgi:hypothetical protein